MPVVKIGLELLTKSRKKKCRTLKAQTVSVPYCTIAV